ncbi:3-phosphoshikimate 1-carboxyvinyltransferase [Curtobacterium sp. MCBD17_013]|uniref:3-phosphoshikimate 1-carboxyvinyltransferase n=1 Tax=unclassified Curtobacterium TaxID=257496 RepID=UPI000DAA331F|nr:MULTISPECIES: 3-phosphoshikimate 1-carboxyvinyltransferase [unclassified Curtobacterium]PZF65345.1 3-phosphoshikimate 1-carboxyvinyltransferase [Curtobacterium sp. MCBD17_013]WIB62459.1 3-phosphoshikimate 1-carboxyvinyltransferase [Curtobacterium sp. MCBD17_040]
MQLVVRGTSAPLVGELDIPVSKYHAHRALVLASLAEGTSVVSGISTTRQVEWTVGTLRALGVDIVRRGNDYLVTGLGGRYVATDVVDHGSRGADGLLNMGSSGTTLYFMTGLAALADRPMTLTGMKYFQRRPIKALLTSLTQMGVELEATNDCPPITVQPRRPRGGDVSIAGTLSQWVSGLLLVAPFAEQETRIHITGGRLNEQPYVELTVAMMRQFGLTVEVSDDWLEYRVPANQRATPHDYVIPPDIGSAAFGIAAAGIRESDVLLRGMTSFRTADTDHPESEFLDLATAMGVPMRIDEETGFVRITHDGSPLRPLDIDCQPIPDLLPVLSTMATFAEGTSRLWNVAHIRLKESDRVAAMLQLNRMGGRAEQGADELRVTGVQQLTGSPMSSFNDHRVLMSLAVAASKADGVSALTYPRAYRISYPTFLEAMNSVGLDMEVGDATAALAAADSAEGFDPEDAAEDLGAVAAEETAVPAGIDAEPLVLSERVRALAESDPDGAAVIEVGGPAAVTTTWKQLQDEADQVSALLLELGVRKGESVAMQLPNWREFVAITLGAVQIGAVATPIMPVFGPRETTMTLARSRARVVFLPNVFRKRRPAIELLDVVDEAAAQNRRLAVEHVVVLRSEARGHQDTPTNLPPMPADAMDRVDASEWNWRYYDTALESVQPDTAQIRSMSPGPDDICQLLFTSGTTGEPKGVQHPHRTLGLATAMHVAQTGLGAQDRIYIPSPLAHQTGFLYGMLLAFRLGVAQVIQPVWDGRVALDQAFGAAGATFVQCATPFLTDLVDLVEAGAEQPASLRIFVPTGAAVPRALAQRAATVLGSAILGAFGTSETCLGALSSPSDDPADAYGHDGRALPGIRLRIVDDEGAELPVGSEGNFELHSPTMFDGYLDRPDLTDDVFTPDGWYRTGDLARIDDKGFLSITGRVKDVINRGGEKIPVVEIENLLYQHPLVTDVAIVAMPDERLGERACAFVVSSRDDETLDFGAMQQYLEHANVSKYYWPERLEYIDELPRNAVGKVQKNVLREQAAALVAQKENS